MENIPDEMNKNKYGMRDMGPDLTAGHDVHAPQQIPAKQEPTHPKQHIVWSIDE